MTCARTAAALPARLFAVRLHGVRDNRFGVGARVRVRAAGPRGEHDVYTTVGPGSSSGCQPLQAHCGLGTATRIVFVEVHWPAAGTTQRWTGVPLDRAIALRQDDPAVTVLDRPARRLGGGAR